MKTNTTRSRVLVFTFDSFVRRRFATPVEPSQAPPFNLCCSVPPCDPVRSVASVSWSSRSAPLPRAGIARRPLAGRRRRIPRPALPRRPGGAGGSRRALQVLEALRALTVANQRVPSTAIAHGWPGLRRSASVAASRASATRFACEIRARQLDERLGIGRRPSPARSDASASGTRSCASSSRPFAPSASGFFGSLRQHGDSERLGFGRLLQRDERLRQIHARARVVIRRLRERDPQLALGLGVAPELAQQLAVVLADAGSIGIELERPRERLRRHRQAAVAIGHRRERAERERIVRVDSRDLLHVLERARQRRALGRRRRLQAVVQLDVRARIGQPRIVERPAAARAGGVAEAAQPLLPARASRRSAARDRPAARAAAARAAARRSSVDTRSGSCRRQIVALLRIVARGCTAPARRRRSASSRPSPSCAATPSGSSGGRTGSPGTADRRGTAASVISGRRSRPEQRRIGARPSRPSAVGTTSIVAARGRTTAPGGHAGAAHHQRHPHRRLIDEDGVRQLVVIAEALRRDRRAA